MFIAYITAIFSIMIRGPMDIELPGLGPDSNMTGRFTGLSLTTFQNNLYCKNNKKFRSFYRYYGKLRKV